jgi:hypothetical protein
MAAASLAALGDALLLPHAASLADGDAPSSEYAALQAVNAELSE